MLLIDGSMLDLLEDEDILKIKISGGVVSFLSERSAHEERVPPIDRAERK